MKLITEKTSFPKTDDFIQNSFWSHGDYELVGHGNQTKASCGKFLGFRGCTRVELHNKVTLDGVNYAGKVFVQKVHCSCHKPTCPVCYKHGWAVREAKRIEVRLSECSKRFGQVEHIIVSVSQRDYGLSLEALRSKVVQKILKKRGIVGGVLIFHAFRYRNRSVLLNGIFHPHGWYWSPHFHVLGYILGGYSRCRNCKRKSNCLKGCGGFDDRNYWQGYMIDGYVVKIKDKRKSVVGTAWYQLNHASVKRGVKRFHVATWFGVCSYRKLKITPEKRKNVCPICQSDLDRLHYIGNKSFVCDKNSPEYKQNTLEDMDEGFGDVWFVAQKKSFGRG